jgi:plasmid stabilization system protein ParE
VGAGKSRAAEAVTLPVIWPDEAKAEFYDSEQWYADIGTPLAERFVEALEDTVQLIAKFPFRFPTVHQGRRRVPVRRFPYGLFY